MGLAYDASLDRQVAGILRGMEVLLSLILAGFAAAPVWWAVWMHRHPRPLRRPGAAWVGFAGAILFCWLGSTGMYLWFLAPKDAPEGHPLGAPIFLAVCALALILYVVGSTLSWRAKHSARKWSAELGLATGRRWWPNWLALLGCVFIAPAVVLVIVGAVILVVASGSWTQDQVDSYMYPAMIVAGVVMAVGVIYYFFVRDYLMDRETRRLSTSNRNYLAEGDDS